MAARKLAESSDYEDDYEDDDDDVDDEIDEEETPDVEPGRPHRGRDWRDIERLREERALRALIDDDLELDTDD